MSLNDVKALHSISLTHVYFNPSDHLSHFFAYITLAPIAIMVFYASVIVSRRELAGIFILLGQLSNEGLNFVLKRVIEQERPYGHLGMGYGMPSSHSQFIWFFAVYGSLYMSKYINIEDSSMESSIKLAMFVIAILVTASRVYLGYHTLNQVLVGSTIGILYGIFWYLFVDYLHATGRVDYILSLKISKQFYLKDMYCIKNVPKWEYEQWLNVYKFNQKYVSKLD